MGLVKNLDYALIIAGTRILLQHKILLLTLGERMIIFSLRRGDVSVSALRDVYTSRRSVVYCITSCIPKKTYLIRLFFYKIVDRSSNSKMYPQILEMGQIDNFTVSMICYSKEETAKY